ncbi:MAG: carboxypeptidase regulatory-like domain-containing protein [Ignavibacteriaceae bacterium]
MKRITGLLFTVSLIVLLVSSMQFAQMMQDTLKGHVYAGSEDQNSRVPISNAIIALHSFTMFGDTTLYIATSDSTGAFAIGGIRRGHFMLVCSAAGYSTLFRRDFEMEDHNSSINLYMNDTLSMMGGNVSGRVKFDESDMPIPQAIIEFISVNSANANVFATTNSMGMYSAKVPAGQYYVSCSVSMGDSVSVFQIFYDNAPTISQGDIVNIGNGEMKDHVNFDIPNHIAVKHNFTFTGNVTSTANTPLDSVKINILAAGEDHHNDKSFITSTMTDAMGNFTVTLDSVQQSFNTFIVAAQKDGYKIQFYNKQDAFFRATVLTAFKDTTFSNLNFTLSPVDSNSIYSINGNVKDTSGMGIKGAFVSAIDSASGQPHVAISDSNGNYSIQGLAKGSYFLLFYARGYEHQFFPSADEWEHATAITLDSSMSGLNVVLYHDHQSNYGGEVMGDVHSDKGTALSGVLVTVKDSSGNVVGSAITDMNGSYTIAGLTQGNYTITASVSTYSSKKLTTTYSPTAGTTTVSNFTMAKTVTAVKNQTANLPAKFVLENNYPNPFNPSTIIGFSVPYSSHVTLDIFNVLGQKVAELVNNNLAAGHYSYSFDASKLSSGVYLYRLQTGNFVSVKKMVLSK